MRAGRRRQRGVRVRPAGGNVAPVRLRQGAPFGLPGNAVAGPVGPHIQAPQPSPVRLRQGAAAPISQCRAAPRHTTTLFSPLTNPLPDPSQRPPTRCGLRTRRKRTCFLTSSPPSSRSATASTRVYSPTDRCALWPAWTCVACGEGLSYPGTPTPSCCTTNRCALGPPKRVIVVRGVAHIQRHAHCTPPPPARGDRRARERPTP